ncbi:MAG: hypothetical protein BWX88_01364 [Planctomycetes bacterium ADurb.Bin126]|nr:MAG: hypothetical protein BWX88_01364 [Planctomycetes bacterium ADurb.Bin126]HOD84232.1 hypothetical protein [Phycisphaerae bacterium]HQL72332.1 hypothetical protein [Phycisphaerae bacterium]
MNSHEPTAPPGRLAKLARALNLACLVWVGLWLLLLSDGSWRRASVLTFALIVGGTLAAAGIVLSLAASPARRHYAAANSTGLWAGIAGLVLVAAGVAFPHFIRSREIVWQAQCRENLQTVCKAVESYRAAHDGQYPPNLTHLVQAGMLQVDRLRCPSPSATYQEPNGSYNYYPGPYPPNLPGPHVLAQDRGGNHRHFDGDNFVEKGRNILCETGEIQWQAPPARR